MKPKIIYYEGLFGIFGNWLTRGHIKNLKKLGYECERRGWMDKELIDDKNVVVIGHSFGADAAFRNTEYCALLVTLDYRRVLYKQESTHLRHLNFYQVKRLRGYKIDLADNNKVYGSNHLGLASNSDVYRDILRAIS